MRRIMTVMAGLCFMALTSCYPNNSESESVLTGAEAGETETESPDSALLEMMEAYVMPSQPASDYIPVTDGKGFPAELVNQLGEAVFRDHADTVVAGLNDESLLITKEEFLAMGDDPEHQLADYLLHRNMSDDLFYCCDTNGDGVDEIFAVPVRRDPPESIVVFVKSGGSYIREGFRVIGTVRQYAVFQYNHAFYMAASCEEARFPGEINVRLYRLDSEDFSKDKHHQHICIRKKTEIADSHTLYRNDDFSAVHEIQTYVDEISRDLAAAINQYGAFCGDETARDDLHQAWYERGLELSNVCAIDVDNDGRDEYFERAGAFYSEGQMGRRVTWFTENMERTPDPYTPWNAAGYYVKQLWFKKFEGRTVVFTAFQKCDSANPIFLDVRIHADGKTIPVLDEMITLKKSGVDIMISEQLPYSSTTEYFPLDGDYRDPDFDKAFPENLKELAASFREEVGEPFQVESSLQQSLPGELADYLKGALAYERLDYQIDGYTRRIGKNEFLEKHTEDLEEAEKYWSDEDERYVYEYRLGHETYYLLPFYNYWDSLYLFVYKEADGKLSLCNQFSSPYFGAVVTVYHDELYLMEQPVTYEPEYLWNVYIHKLAPEKDDEYATVEISLKGHQWKTFYSGNGPVKEAAAAYIDSIKDTLLYPAVYDGGGVTYTEDETDRFDDSKLQRLISCAYGDEFYEIDFNNDSVPEYVSKTREGRMDLYFNAYHFNDHRTEIINYDLNRSRDHLMQLWFKEIEGNIYTCKLYHYDEYYVFNMSLVEGKDITQVQSCLVLPEREFRTVPGRIEPKEQKWLAEK